MPHHKHSATVAIVGIRGVVYRHAATIIVVGVRCVICELSASRSRVACLFPALLFIVAVFSTVPAFKRVVTLGRSDMMTRPSARLSGTIPVQLPLVGVTLLSLPTITALSELTSISMAKISSIIRLGVEHLTLWCVAPLLGMIFFNQQY